MADTHPRLPPASFGKAGRPRWLAGLVLGLGVGGFIDGIVLHQLMGWHHMLSGWYPDDAHINMIGDGLFHLGCLIVVVIGVVLLSAARPGPVGELVGWMIAGWGLFNLVEGVIDHQVLGVHHVRQGPHRLLYDLAFLASGVVLLALGVFLARVSAGRQARSTGRIGGPS